MGLKLFFIFIFFVFLGVKSQINPNEKYTFQFAMNASEYQIDALNIINNNSLLVAGKKMKSRNVL